MELLPLGYEAPLRVWLEMSHNFVRVSLVVELPLRAQVSHLSDEGFAAGGFSMRNKQIKGLYMVRLSGVPVSQDWNHLTTGLCPSGGQTLLYHIALALSQKPIASLDLT